MKTTTLLIFGLIFTFCLNANCQTVRSKIKKSNSEVSNSDLNKIQILNFATFHMGETADLNKTEFDENDKENKNKVHEIAKMLSAFKPTVILVETPPSFDPKLQAEYNQYLKTPEMVFKKPSEIELLAYELGRLSGTKQIYGIDHKLGYNYMIGDEIKNVIDSTWYKKYYKDPLKYYPEVSENQDKMNLLDKLKLNNQSKYLDFLIAVNADMLTHAGTEKGFEGADEAAKYYQRNLRMYSNMNRLDLKPSDRVFIVMGGSHSAFFRDFIGRSPKYFMVNTFDYLK